MKLPNMIIICLMLLTSSSIKAAIDQNEPHHIIIAGRVDLLQLSAFATNDLDSACDQLLKGDYQNAANTFRNAYNKDPQNLAAFIGMIQANPSEWNHDIDSLQLPYKQNPNNAVTLFKLGALYFYRGEVEYVTVAGKSGERDILQGIKMLRIAWSKQENPIIGLLYAQSFELLTPTRAMTYDVVDKLILKEAGRKVYNKYIKSKHSGWSGNPPDINAVPKGNLKLLCGLIRLDKSAYLVRFGNGSMINGKMVVKYTPLSSYQLRAKRYLDKWIEILNHALKK